MKLCSVELKIGHWTAIKMSAIYNNVGMISEDLSIAYYLDSQHLLNQHHPVFPMNLFFFISLMVAWKKSTDVEHHICSFFQTEGIGRRRSYFKILITTHRHSIRQTILEFMSRTTSIEEDVLYDL